MKGRCYCGEVQYEITEKPLMKAQCHCRECQYLTGGGPNFFMDKAEVEKIALATDAVTRALDGAQPKKVIVVPGRIVNVVV